MPFHPFLMTKLMLQSHRAPVTRTPADAGLEYEDVAFEASDGVGLKGWFIASAIGGRGPVVVFVHGWMWNRLGNVAGQTVVPDRDVDFLPAVKALHDAGFHVLTFDLRGHGESESGKGPQTYGPIESRDFVGAVTYLRTRSDVDGDRIGAIGTSAGGNTVLYGVEAAQPVKAVLVIQPTRLTSFNTNFAKTELGRFGPMLMKPVDLLYAVMRAPRPSRQDPAVPARRLNGTAVQYVQGTGDQWGEMAVVEEFAAATPGNVGPVVKFPSTERYSGYQYISKRSEDVVAFFRDHL
jgi:pimeloyl-ACP methyl ester carboxylesterase